MVVGTSLMSQRGCWMVDTRYVGPFGPRYRYDICSATCTQRPPTLGSSSTVAVPSMYTLGISMAWPDSFGSLWGASMTTLTRPSALMYSHHRARWRPTKYRASPSHWYQTGIT